MIPHRLIRVVPEETTEQIETWWKQACQLHPYWNHVTLRDPINPRLFPLTRDLWDTCKSGAQLADLVRTEELYHRGGVYIDSDVEVFKPFDVLTHQTAFAAYEEPGSVPNAIMGFRAHHPALLYTLRMARDRHAVGTYHSGAGVTSHVFPRYDDILLLPPGALYPVYWRHRDIADWDRVQELNPWAFACHHAHHSWAGT